jgi:hypothetical protein
LSHPQLSFAAARLTAAVSIWRSSSSAAAGAIFRRERSEFCDWHRGASPQKFFHVGE